MVENRERLEKFTIKKYTSVKLPDDDEVLQTAKLFGEVFAGSPWFETTKCNHCENMFGPETEIGTSCAKCDEGVLIQAYPITETKNIILDTFQKENAVMFLAFENNQVVGFTWGFQRNTEEYINKFYAYSNDAGNSLGSFFNLDKNFFSLAEIGIKQSARGQGLGKELFANLVNNALNIDLPLTGWTRNDTIITPICLKMGFAQIFGPETIFTDGKVQTTGRIINGIDPEVERRVLFVKR